MEDTGQLLREYSQNRSEKAFEAIVARYLNLVFSTALRLLGGDTHLAEDTCQEVFANLARKAASLPENTQLGGWLHRHTCFVASSMRRAKSRRELREKEAVEMKSID